MNNGGLQSACTEGSFLWRASLTNRWLLKPKIAFALALAGKQQDWSHACPSSLLPQRIHCCHYKSVMWQAARTSKKEDLGDTVSRAERLEEKRVVRSEEKSSDQQLQKEVVGELVRTTFHCLLLGGMRLAILHMIAYGCVKGLTSCYLDDVEV